MRKNNFHWIESEKNGIKVCQYLTASGSVCSNIELYKNQTPFAEFWGPCSDEEIIEYIRSNKKIWNLLSSKLELRKFDFTKVNTKENYEVIATEKDLIN